jgi:hypothetical protein
VIVIRYPGRLLTSEEAANWVGVLNDKIQVLNHMIETATSKAERIYKWRNRLLLVGFCGLLASKIFAPYLNS